MSNNSQDIQAKLTELGGSMIGGATGEMAGAMVGGAIITLVTGPLGLCTSAVMLTFVAGVLGSKLGGAIANTVNQVSEVSSTQDPDSLQETAAEAFQESAAEKLEEGYGEVIGGLTGLLLAGHKGELVGTIVGGNIARQFRGETANL
ncbi:hypothetical protein LEP3755_24980 [Leptolyngbya sp. NIES-3755]|nr:hypothetical protein LEP3755_24980 [Leptolyngbya sp. NIES-3755]